jgi:hypothetical protein
VAVVTDLLKQDTSLEDVQYLAEAYAHFTTGDGGA